MRWPDHHLPRHARDHPRQARRRLAASREMGAFLEANHPRMLHFGIYIDDDAHQMTVIQVHPDEDSLVLHSSWPVSGSPRPTTSSTPPPGSRSTAAQRCLVDQIRQMGMGAPIRFNVPTAGFSRLASIGD